MHELHWTLPSILEMMDNDEFKAFVIASINIRAREEKKQARKLERG
jgi:hypothetical protein